MFFGSIYISRDGWDAFGPEPIWSPDFRSPTPCSHGQMVPQNFVPLDKWSPTNLVTLDKWSPSNLVSNQFGPCISRASQPVPLDKKNILGTICPWGLNWLGTIYPEGPIYWGPIVGNQVSGNQCVTAELWCSTRPEGKWFCQLLPSSHLASQIILIPNMMRMKMCFKF